MSGPYTAEDARYILEAFVGEFLVDIPSNGVETTTQRLYYGGSGDGVPITTHDLTFSESDIAQHIFWEAEASWFEDIARFATENNAES